MDDDETVTLENTVTPETPLLGEDHLQEQRDDDERRPSSRPIIRRLWYKLILSPLRDGTTTTAAAAGSSSSSLHGCCWSSVVVGLTTLTIVGTFLGLLLPQNQNLPTPWYRAVSAAIGYTYFLCWSVSFYPQVVANYTRKSTQGLSTDFCVLNVLGFVCYAIYNVCFFYSKTIQDMYKERHHGSQITVQSNDVAFAVHAVCLSVITLMQIAYYNNNNNNNNNGSGSYNIRAIIPSRVIGWIIIGIVVTILTYASIVVAIFHKSTWLDFLYLLSYIKILVSLIKYIPQVILNIKRKSTVGWSIWNILLDLTGGLLSILQLVLDCANLGDWTGITGNSAKFGLGFVSIFFDLFFMLQHYVLYPDADQQQQQQQPPPGAEDITTTVPPEQEENTDDNNNNNDDPNETV